MLVSPCTKNKRLLLASLVHLVIFGNLSEDISERRKLKLEREFANANRVMY